MVFESMRAYNLVEFPLIKILVDYWVDFVPYHIKIVSKYEMAFMRNKNTVI